VEPESHDVPASSSREERPPRRFGWLWVPVVLVVGILVGGVIVAVFSDGGTVHPATPTPTVTVTEHAPSGQSSGAQVHLADACLRAVNDAQTAYSLLTHAGSAVRNFDVKSLDGIVQRAQAVQRLLAHDLRRCHATIQVPSGPGSATPLPSAS
jgi:hypothetical protein